MRVIFLGLLLSALVCFYWLKEAGQLEVSLEQMKKDLHQLIHYKELSISGLKYIDREELIRHMPMEKSVLWWIIFKKQVEEQLSKHLHIKSAYVKLCGSISWGCFKVYVYEKRPFFIAFVGDKAWQVDKEGAFVRPLTVAQAQSQDRGLPLVNGIVVENLSPEVVQARLVYVGKALELIEKEAGLGISEILIKPSGEMTVQFKDYFFKAIFKADGTDFGNIKVEAKRLKKLLKEFSGREDDLGTIDLALEKSAVVKLKNQESQ